MQERKICASINASFDFSSGTLSAVVQGDHTAVCFILGQLVQNVALSKARVKGIPEEQAMKEVFRVVEEAAHFSYESGTRIDLSYKYKEG